MRHNQSRKALGADKVTCRSLSDGYDYSFHIDYRRAGDRTVDGIREAAAYLPEIRLFMEYKPSKTRVHCTLDSAAKALLLCYTGGSPNLAVTIHFGHSVYGGESRAEALAMVASSGFAYYVHINDNNGKWD
jgi:xylose isomerase